MVGVIGDVIGALICGDRCVIALLLFEDVGEPAHLVQRFDRGGLRPELCRRRRRCTASIISTAIVLYTAVYRRGLIRRRLLLAAAEVLQFNLTWLLTRLLAEVLIGSRVLIRLLMKLLARGF